MDFSVEDRVDPIAFNRILWEGLMGSKPYPSNSSGLDLRENRRQLLDQYRAKSPEQDWAQDPENPSSHDIPTRE
jgi:hypothetical protein